MKTILIVEDSNEIREEISDIFKMENYNVFEASNGHEGYIAAINEIPDLIISDILMPLVNGYGMYERLKENPLTDNIPVIFLSALSSDNDIRKGMNLGADDYLTKPLIPKDLILAANNKLEKYAKIESKVENLKINITEVLQHELRTPLNGIVGFSDYLRERVFDLPKEEVEKIVNHIYKSGKRLHILVEKYLNYADLKMKSIQTSELKKIKKCEYFNTAEIINYVAEEIGKRYNRQEDFIIDTTFAEVKMDEFMFVKIIEELIENALKFSKKGGKIKISSDANNDRLKIRIKNEGIGMTSDEIRNINDFRQFNKKLLAQNGSGIGLSIVQLITEIYNIEFNIISMYKQYLTAILIFNNNFNI
ncbi:MAG: response regulator [Bacteroidales bacterium]|nr:response regulator [Bacteroidales bacterium]